MQRFRKGGAAPAWQAVALTVLTVCIVLALCTVPASATQFVDLSLEQLLNLSPHVVRGKVAEVESRWNADRTAVVTRVRVEVEEAFKGVGFGKLVVEVPGGRVGEHATYVSGSPSFAPDEEVILFLRPERGGSYQVVEMAHGKYHIERDADGKAWIAGELEMKPLLAEKALELDDRGRMPLDRFLASLRPLAQAQGGGQWIEQ